MSDVPVKKQVDFGRATAGNRSDRSKPGHAVHRFFDGACDGDGHLIDWHDAVVHTDHYAREVSGWKY